MEKNFKGEFRLEFAFLLLSANEVDVYPGTRLRSGGKKAKSGSNSKKYRRAAEQAPIHRSARFARQYFCCLTSFFAYSFLKWLQRPYKKRILSYVFLWSALYVLYKMNDDLLPLSLMTALEDHYHWGRGRSNTCYMDMCYC